MCHKTAVPGPLRPLNEIPPSSRGQQLTLSFPFLKLPIVVKYVQHERLPVLATVKGTSYSIPHVHTVAVRPSPPPVSRTFSSSQMETPKLHSTPTPRVLPAPCSHHPVPGSDHSRDLTKRNHMACLSGSSHPQDPCCGLCQNCPSIRDRVTFHYGTVFVYLSAQGALGCSRLLDTGNNAAVNTGVAISLYPLLICQDIHPEGRSGPCSNSVFGGSSGQFPISNAQRVHFLPIPVSTWDFVSDHSHPCRGEVTSRWPVAYSRRLSLPR